MPENVTWTSTLPEFEKLLAKAEDDGLIAAAQVGVNNTKRKLRGGYTSGDFVTGRSINSVTKSQPFNTATGRAIRYGTNLLYNLFWELGHHNIYLRRFVRVEKWRPAFVESYDAMRRAYTRVMTRTLAPFQASNNRGAA